jgi:hypothetical protein
MPPESLLVLIENGVAGSRQQRLPALHSDVNHNIKSIALSK